MELRRRFEAAVMGMFGEPFDVTVDDASLEEHVGGVSSVDGFATIDERLCRLRMTWCGDDVQVSVASCILATRWSA